MDNDGSPQLLNLMGLQEINWDKTLSNECKNYYLKNLDDNGKELIVLLAAEIQKEDNRA